MLKKFEPQTYALLRIFAGLMFAMHGSQKLLGWPPMEGGGGGGGGIATLMMVAGVIELVGGLMIAIGLFADIAAFISSGQMAVAFFVAHFPNHWNPVVNKGETAVLYCFIFLFIAAHGSGIWSVDQARGRARTT